MTNAFRPGDRVKARHPDDGAYYPVVIECIESTGDYLVRREPTGDHKSPTGYRSGSALRARWLVDPDEILR
jgi:hypothetical protein